MPNVYLEKTRGFVAPTGLDYFDKLKLDLPMSAFTQRRSLVKVYSWAIPNQEALDAIAKYSPIVEIGAGTGYWVMLLREMGVDVVAYDIAFPGSENHWHSEEVPLHTQVLIGGTEKAGEHSDRTLFLCWPPYDSDMADKCIDAYKGRYIIYVGEGGGGCTGGIEKLEQSWEKVEEVEIPQWQGLNDYLSVWTRRPMYPLRCKTWRFVESADGE